VTAERTGRFRVYRVVEALPHIDLVEMGFAVDATVPEVAHALWEEGRNAPAIRRSRSAGRAGPTCHQKVLLSGCG